MIDISIDQTSGNIIVKTDILVVKSLLEVKRTITKYVFWKKAYANVEEIVRIYEEKRATKHNGIYTFTVKKGFTCYLAMVLKPYISKEQSDLLLNSIYSPTSLKIPFRNLLDIQNDDILYLLKYKFGLFTCYTGYGKTEVIATLANYALSLGKKVLLVTPGSKARDELIKRCKNRFNLDPSDNLKFIITSGFMNRLDYRDPIQRQNIVNELKTFDWVLSDEVEYCINPAGEFIFSNCSNATNFYGFSGTADKKSGKMVSFCNGLDETIVNNLELVKYFGPSLVYRMPLDKVVNNIKIKTNALNKITFTKEDDEKDGNVYMTIMNKIWTDPDICNLIVKLAYKYPMMFIPVNNLSEIIMGWINNYFLGKFRILLVCGEGYIYYDLNGDKTSLTLDEACDYIKKGVVDIIPSTSSGYRALDFPNLKYVFSLQGNNAGVFLQYVGRIRAKEMNVISLEPCGSKKIPVYTKGSVERDRMIHEFYKYCEVNDISINEENI